MKFKCYLCGKQIQTNDLFGRMSFNIENQDDIITTLDEYCLCSWCVSRFDYYKRIIAEIVKKERKK